MYNPFDYVPHDYEYLTQEDRSLLCVDGLDDEDAENVLVCLARKRLLEKWIRLGLVKLVRDDKHRITSIHLGANLNSSEHDGFCLFSTRNGIPADSLREDNFYGVYMSYPRNPVYPTWNAVIFALWIDNAFALASPRDPDFGVGKNLPDGYKSLWMNCYNSVLIDSVMPTVPSA